MADPCHFEKMAYPIAMDKPNILTEEDIEKALSELPGWVYKDSKISKEFEFRDFMGSLAFINRLAPYFEEVDHHPDTHLMYSKVLFELSRYDVGGKVTDKDIAVAKKIEDEYASGKR